MLLMLAWRRLCLREAVYGHQGQRHIDEALARSLEMVIASSEPS